MIIFKHRGNFDNTDRFFNRMKLKGYRLILEKYAREGVYALEQATPKDSGITANSWSYVINYDNGGATISWTNSSENNGLLIAVLVQYGHGTRNGTFVEGRDYINPAMKPIFDEIAENLWKEITNL